MNKLKRKFRQYQSAMKTGAIVGKCKTGCRLDDEAEEVIPCLFHRAEIARLAQINEECS